MVNFRRSDLVKPNGPMLEQHADAIEGELSKVGLTLLPESTGKLLRPGDKLPVDLVSSDVRAAREARRRKLRSTM